jgi:hypothetical protein
MELWIIYLVNYLCIAVSLGISSSIVVLKPANVLARELIVEQTDIDKHPIIGYTTWILSTTVMFPYMAYKFFTANYEEEIPEVAARLAAGKE